MDEKRYIRWTSIEKIAVSALSVGFNGESSVLERGTEGRSQRERRRERRERDGDSSSGNHSFWRSHQGACLWW